MKSLTKRIIPLVASALVIGSLTGCGNSRQYKYECCDRNDFCGCAYEVGLEQELARHTRMFYVGMPSKESFAVKKTYRPCCTVYYPTNSTAVIEVHNDSKSAYQLVEVTPNKLKIRRIK